MKSKYHPFLYVAGSEGQEERKKAEPQKSPYLKAILSGTAGSAVVRKILSAVGSDKAAASRYIKETAFLRKV
jgi:hypothetical protein